MTVSSVKLVSCVILIFVVIWCVTEASSSSKNQLSLQQLASWPEKLNRQLGKKVIPEKRAFTDDDRALNADENGHFPGECCPVRKMWIEPKGGISQNGRILALYPGQRFYQISCASGSRDKPCQFIKEEFASFSRCIQLYSYSYAIVKEFDAPEDDWRYDFIKVRSGCSCILIPKRYDKPQPEQ